MCTRTELRLNNLPSPVCDERDIPGLLFPQGLTVFCINSLPWATRQKRRIHARTCDFWRKVRIIEWDITHFWKMRGQTCKSMSRSIKLCMMVYHQTKKRELKNDGIICSVFSCTNAVALAVVLSGCLSIRLYTSIPIFLTLTDGSDLRNDGVNRVALKLLGPESKQQQCF